ncbi:hypothetical protein PPACK8108_LOCUS24255 [Phakopsora pachyrhizi]|uniref:Uncharacterized protein n=1 Tax=Phakopsora pachyrhizi TaxID=170000 RepID=A0AAV0BSG9_PHAPC|nr:hypothetical protein PPACK8108_LOCUS24255 [Phakopsora pachyrhizi]
MSCRAPEKSKPAMICNVKKCEGNLVCQNCLTDLTHVKIDSVNCESYSRMDDSTTRKIFFRKLLIECIYDNNYFTCSGECTGGAQCSECEVEVTGQTSSSSSNKNSASQATTGGNGVKTWLSWR